VSPDATEDLKQALQVVQFALELTNCLNKDHMVPMFTWRPLVMLLVQLKQMMSTVISSLDFGTENEE